MDYSTQGVKKQLRLLSSKTTRMKSRFVLTLLKLFVVAVVSATAMGAGTGLGIFNGILDNTPDINNIDVSPLGFATTIYDTQGNLIQTLIREGSNRDPIEYGEMTEDLKNAFIAIEDARFWTHSGIDIKGIFRSAYNLIKEGQVVSGGSTITQQLIKNNVFGGGDEQSYGELIERKVQEQYLSLQLEETMSKEDILENYLNTINLGSGTLGVQAAATRYFGKDVSELTLSECTVLAAITSNPTYYNPIRNPEKNAVRRKIVLEYMYEQGLISEAQMQEALNDNVYDRIAEVNVNVQDKTDVYSYFVDELTAQVINDLVEEAGYTEDQAYAKLYSGGLRIYTTQDPAIQAIVDEEVSNPNNYSINRYGFTYQLSVQSADNETTHYSESHVKQMIKNGEYGEFFTFENDAERENAEKLIFESEERINEVIAAFRAITIKDTDTELGENLYISLQPQASFVLMDQETGYVRALSGGRGEKTVSLGLNRATNTTRQPGSTFKVLASFAPALDTAGATLATTYYDTEYTVGDKTFSNWWGNQYVGYANIRQGIVYSMNILATQCLMQTVSPQLGYQYANEFGITTLVENREYADGTVRSDIGSALALGGLTDGVTNLEMTAAYAAIANGGVYTEPIFYTKIVDNTGNTIIDKTTNKETHTVIKSSTAFLLTNAMAESCEPNQLFDLSIYSTSSETKVEGMSTAGKSGTTTNNNDQWFIGYTPYYTAGIWEGYDENLALDNGKEHKYIWNKIMTRVHEELADPGFTMPDDIEQVQVCAKSGKLAIEGCCDRDPRGSMVYTEYFTKGTAPTTYCDHHTTITVCADSGYVPSAYCPTDHLTTGVFMIVPTDTAATADSAYVASTYASAVCPIHAAPETTEEETTEVPSEETVPPDGTTEIPNTEGPAEPTEEQPANSEPPPEGEAGLLDRLAEMLSP